MKFGMSNYKYSFIHITKIEFSRVLISGDTTSKTYPSHEGSKSSNSDIYALKMGLTSKDKVFYVQNYSFRPRIDHPINFQNFQAEKIFSVFKYLDTS